MRSLTPAQRELWTAGDPADPALWTGSYLDITGPLDAAALCAAIDATAAEDDAAHLRFTPHGQRLDPTPAAPTRVRSVPDPVAEMRADLTADVDLERGPLVRQAVYRVDAERHLWFTRVHHLVHDGRSTLIVRARVADHYAALTGARPAGPPLGRYWDLLDELDRYPGSAAYHRDRAYWVRTMTEPVTGAPPDDWRTEVLSAVDGDLFSFPLPGRIGPLAARTPAMLMTVLPLRRGADLRRMAWHQRYPTADLRRDLAWPSRWFGPYVTLLDARGPAFGPTTTTTAVLSTGLRIDEPVVTAIRHDDGTTVTTGGTG